MAPGLRSGEKLWIVLCGTHKWQSSKDWGLCLPTRMEAQSLGRILDQREVEKALAPKRHYMSMSNTLSREENG